MKTEISRNSNQPDKRYSGVYQQQGRMLTDADWNELSDLAKDRLNDVLRDVIGSGTPQARSIVSVETLPDGSKEYKLQWGYAYVDGIQAQLTPREDATISTPPSLDEIYSNQADFPQAPSLPVSDDYKLYLDVWERTVVSLEDKELSDPGLHGADTCTRTQTMAQLKWCEITETPSSFPTKGSALLTLQVRQGSTQPDPCDPCADKVPIQKNAGNYLFRVEVHDVGYNSAGNPERITLKWSSENGAEQFDKTNLPPGFASEKWVYEFFSDEAEDFESEKHLGYHKHTDPAWSPTRYPLESGYPSVEPTTMVRRWDGYCTLVNNSGNWELASDGSALLGVDLGVALSNGGSDDDLGHISEGPTAIINLSSIILTLDLNGKQLLAGDYWAAPVREAVHMAGDVLLGPVEPCGIIHHHLALASVSSGVVTGFAEDACKPLEFPSLTDLHADDVCFDNAKCKMPSAGNVQEAIDNLCRERDIQWHNKHLHGWGVICGLKVKCHSDREKVVVEPGHALDCEGFRLQVNRRDKSRFVDIVKNAEKQGLLDDDGNGSVSLWIDHGQDHPVQMNIEAHTPQDFWDTVLEGTLLKDFFDDCILSLITFALGQFPTSLEDEPPVTEAQRRLTAFINLYFQLINPSSGRYVFLSSREDSLLREFYADLKAFIASETFCAMFDDDRPFPDYTLDSGLDTFFGPTLHFSNRLRLNHSRNMAYTCGLDNKIYIYDLTSQNLIQTLTFPGGDNIVVQDVAISTDGLKMYAVALVDEKDSVFASANIDRDGIHTWGPTAVVCGKKFLTLATSPEFPENLYAICSTRGLYVFDPDNISVSPGGADVPFNATGLLVLSADGTLACAALNKHVETESSEMTHIRNIDLKNIGGNEVLYRIDGNDEQNDIAIHGNIVYLTGHIQNNPEDRVLVGYNITTGNPSGFSPVVLEGASITRLAVLNTPSGEDHLLITLSDSFKVLKFDLASNKLDANFRIPAQLFPIDIEATSKSTEAYVLNMFSNTLTAIDVETVLDPSAPPNYTEEPPTESNVISIYRQGVINAFSDLLSHLLEYLKDGFCDKFLIDCPECNEDEKVYLGVVEIRGKEVYKICNFSKRHYIKSFPTWSYWLSTVPILPLLKRGFELLCCSTIGSSVMRKKS